MPGPLPKPAALRQRRNRTSTAATLPSEASTRSAKIPALPKRRQGTGSWLPEVRAWWAEVWRSPMATEFMAADRKRLEIIADLHQRYHLGGPDVLKIASEIRLQEREFGLTPMDRRRLQWEIDRGESAEQRTKHRRAPKADPAKDPRSQIRAVS